MGVTAELGYDDMTCDHQCLLADTVEDISIWMMKGTLRLDDSMLGGDIMPFLAASISEGGTNTITNGTAIFTTDTVSSQLSAEAGVSAIVSCKTAIPERQDHRRPQQRRRRLRWHGRRKTVLVTANTASRGSQSKRLIIVGLVVLRSNGG